MNLQFQEPTMPCSIPLKRVTHKEPIVFISQGCDFCFWRTFCQNWYLLKRTRKKLNRALEKRLISDYAYTFVISREEAEEILENGKKFVEKIVQHLEEKRIL